MRYFPLKVPILILFVLCIFGATAKDFVSSTTGTLQIQSPSRIQDNIDTYYSSINPSATDLELKTQLKALINPHIVHTYDEAWVAFAQLDRFSPTFPCDTNITHIPDVYSSYCWSMDKVTPGGECGNYQKEGDCFNREVRSLEIFLFYLSSLILREI